MRFRSCNGLLASLLLGALLGCGAKDVVEQAVNQAQDAAATDQTRDQLKVLGIAYHNHHDAQNRGPADWDEAIASASDPAAVQALRDKGYQVAWGLRLRDVTVGTSNFVLAYKPEDLNAGGYVLMMDGAVMHRPAEEIQAALDAQKDIKPAAS